MHFQCFVYVSLGLAENVGFPQSNDFLKAINESRRDLKLHLSENFVREPPNFCNDIHFKLKKTHVIFEKKKKYPKVKTAVIKIFVKFFENSSSLKSLTMFLSWWFY